MARSIIIWDAGEQSSMGGGSWNEEIICTLRKDGTFSLRARKSGDDSTVSMTFKTRIRSPQVFVQALIDMADSWFNYEIDHKEIVAELCPKLDELDPKFSREIMTYIGTLDGKS
jgi:hypothetical protein